MYVRICLNINIRDVSRNFRIFLEQRRKKNIFLAWSWVDILQKWDITLFRKCFLLLIAHCYLFFLMTNGTTGSTGQYKGLVGQHSGHIDSPIHTWFCWLYNVGSFQSISSFAGFLELLLDSGNYPLRLTLALSSVHNQFLDDNFTEINQMFNFFIWRKLSVEVECICQKYF